MSIKLGRAWLTIVETMKLIVSLEIERQAKSDFLSKNLNCEKKQHTENVKFKRKGDKRKLLCMFYVPLGEKNCYSTSELRQWAPRLV